MAETGIPSKAWLDNLDESKSYPTQGGGRVQWDSTEKRYIFVVAPDVPGYSVGDAMPDDWSIAPC